MESNIVSVTEGSLEFTEGSLIINFLFLCFIFTALALLRTLWSLA